MNRSLIVSIVVFVLVVSAGGMIVYAHGNLPLSRTPNIETKISAEEYERMSHIISLVNKGELPASALKDAESLLRQEPELLHPSIPNPYK